MENRTPIPEVEIFHQNLRLRDVFGQKPLAYEIPEEEYLQAWTWYEEKGKKRRGGPSDYFYKKISPEAHLRGIKCPEVTYVYPEDSQGKRTIRYHVREDYQSHEERFLAWWIPSQKEREIILSIAGSIAGGKKPTIADVGCGSGLSINLLAQGNNINAIGIDPSAEKDRELVTNIPQPLNVVSQKIDIWDTINQLGPKYSSANTKKRNHLFKVVRQRVGEKPIIQTFGDAPDFQTGDPQALNAEVNHLQTIAGNNSADTSVDLALCSFMPLHQELTVPIRDGLYPKAIVYVIPTNGRAGAGEYYSYMRHWSYDHFKDDEETRKWISEQQLNDDSVISFHPGRNYQTVARWFTPSKLIWETDYWRDEQFQKENKFTGDPTNNSARVVIQLRKDVAQVLQLSHIATPHYGLDNEFDRYLYSDGIGFGNSLNEAYNALFR